MNGSHFKLGLFVSIAVTLLVLFLLMLGVLDRFGSKVMAETYFLEPIKNLESGAAVRFRGVKVGVVDWVGFAMSKYDIPLELDHSASYRGYIMATMRLDGDLLERVGDEEAEELVQRAVDQGLRARLQASGLGGPTFIEVDYVDPSDFPPPALVWQPEQIYIPSAPSTIGEIIDSLAAILRKVEQDDVINELAALGGDMRRVLGELESSGLLSDSGGALQELRAASAEARALLADPRLDRILDDAGATLERTRTLLARDGGELTTLVADMTAMAETLDRAGNSLDTVATTLNEGDLIERMETLAADLGPAGRDLSALATRLNRLVVANEVEVADTIKALRDAALELEAMLEDLKANPSRILADPPSRRTPGGTP